MTTMDNSKRILRAAAEEQYGATASLVIIIGSKGRRKKIDMDVIGSSVGFNLIWSHVLL